MNTLASAQCSEFSPTHSVGNSTPRPGQCSAAGTENTTTYLRLGAGSKVKEAHKIFDEVNIVVRSGDGGQGEIVASGTGRWVTNLKYKPGGNMRKQIWLPASELCA